MMPSGTLVSRVICHFDAKEYTGTKVLFCEIPGELLQKKHASILPGLFLDLPNHN